jgi:acetate kinase
MTAGRRRKRRTHSRNDLRGLEYLGIDIGLGLQPFLPARALYVEISKPTSKVHVYVIPTDEEMTIARDTAALAL